MTDARSIVKAPERLWRADGDGGTLQATLAAAGVGEVALVDGDKARDKSAFMREVARALKFPDYFGANWDAFAECLDDLHWKDVPIFLVIEHGDALLTDEPAELDPLLHILEDAFAADPELPNSALKVIVATPPTAPVLATARRLGLSVGQV